MRRTNASWAALPVASVALFTSLGGAAWAAGVISGSQIQNRSITGKKIGRGQVTAVNLGRDHERLPVAGPAGEVRCAARVGFEGRDAFGDPGVVDLRDGALHV